MMSSYSKLKNRANNLAVRERVIATAALMMLLVGLSDVSFFRNFSHREANLLQELNGLEQRIESYQQKIFDLDNLKVIDPNEKLKNDIKKESLRAVQLDIQFSKSKNDLVPPEKVLSILGSMLGKKSGLELMLMSTLPPVEINNEIKNSSVNLYKHQLSLDFTGTYENVRKYVWMLENLNEKVFLDQLLFKTIEYPKAEFTLKVHTFTTGEALIGG